jgi:hypothetical protein
MRIACPPPYARKLAGRQDSRNEVMHVAPMRSVTRVVQDHVALAEIELCGELIIAASAAQEERLSPDRIDEVLKVTSEESM